MNMSTVGVFGLGLVLLIVGAEALVRGASRLAGATGLSPLVIGLTVVAFGTSAPEMAVSVQAALAPDGGADIALGNVVGSNIFNVLLILGASALAGPLLVEEKLVRWDVPLMIALSFSVWLLAANGTVGRSEGALLFVGVLGYTAFAILQGRQEARATRSDQAAALGTKPKGIGFWIMDVLFVLIGLALLVLGSRWLVKGAAGMARNLGVSDLVISLTVVAAGTSLPELATSVLASVRKERDIAVGNVVGSNIFNLSGVLGLSALASPLGLRAAPAAVRFDLPVMTAVAVACLPVFFTGCRISRWEGAVFVGYYVLYTIYLILGATQHDLLPAFSLVLLLFVVPITVLTGLIMVTRQVRSSKAG